MMPAVARQHALQGRQCAVNEAQVGHLGHALVIAGVISLTGENTEHMASLTQTSIGPNSSLDRCRRPVPPARGRPRRSADEAPGRRGPRRRGGRLPARPGRGPADRCGPRRANARTAARPTPAEAPVITTTSGLPQCASFLPFCLAGTARCEVREEQRQCRTRRDGLAFPASGGRQAAKGEPVFLGA